MKDAAESLPSGLAAAHAMILGERHARLTAEANAAAAATNAAVARAEAANAISDLTSIEELIAHLNLAIENAAGSLQTVKSFERKRPSRDPFPDRRPRERVFSAAPESRTFCGSFH